MLQRNQARHNARPTLNKDIYEEKTFHVTTSTHSAGQVFVCSEKSSSRAQHTQRTAYRGAF